MRQKRAADPEFRKRGARETREWQKANPFLYAWNNNKASAKKRGWEWQIDRETHDALLLCDCTYCGAKPDPLNGIDRIDNAIGYTPSNVTASCADCNYAKRKMTVEQFVNWARRVVNHSQKD